MNRQHTPIVQTLDSAIHRINHYPADKRSGNPPYEHIVANTIFFQPKRKNLLITELFYYFGDVINATTSFLRQGFYGPTTVALINGVPL